MTTATKTFQALRSHAETIKNDEPQRVETCSPGDAWPQGDLLLVCLERLPKGATQCEPVQQLAPGTSQGSRHMLDSLEGIRMFRLHNATPLDGPIIVAEREFTVEHPEHGNITLPAGHWGVVYQRQLAEDLRRVQD